MLSTLTKDRRDIRLNWLEENFGSIGKSTGSDQDRQLEFWLPGYVENRRKNNNLVREGFLKSLCFKCFSSVVNAVAQELSKEASGDPLVRGNILRHHWSQLSTATDRTQAKRRKNADPKGNLSSKKPKLLNTPTAEAATPSASVEEQAPEAPAAAQSTGEKSPLS